MRVIAKRLETAVKQWGTTHAFSTVMVELGIRCSSLRMVQLYLAGTHTPSLEFVHAAAKILGVREPWLALGEEPMTSVVDEALTVAVESEWEWIIGSSDTIRAQLHALLNRRIVAVKSRGGEVDEDQPFEHPDLARL